MEMASENRPKSNLVCLYSNSAGPLDNYSIIKATINNQ